MSKLYAAPAGVDDASGSPKADEIRASWHKRVSKYIADAKKGHNTFFYDQLADSPDIADSPPSPITWNAYPKWVSTVFSGFPPPLNVAAEDAFAESPAPAGLYEQQPNGKFSLTTLQRRRQDEYCEWHVKRSGTKVLSMTFTAEPPEYWSHLFAVDPELVVKLYRNLLRNDTVSTADLTLSADLYERLGAKQVQLVYKKGEYNPFNKWNVGPEGLVHLTHRANTLGAEVQLAADATVDWHTSQQDATPDQRICCAQYGEPSRHSDPLIGWNVGKLIAATKACIALADPIGLYIMPFSLPGLKDPNGKPIGDKALTFPRRSADGSRILRAELRPPEGAAYTLDECTLGGQKLEFGGAIARGITMSLYGTAKVIPGRVRGASNCAGFCCAHPMSPALLEGYRFLEHPNCADVPANEYRPLPAAPEHAEAFAQQLPELTDALAYEALLDDVVVKTGGVHRPSRKAL